MCYVAPCLTHTDGCRELKRIGADEDEAFHRDGTAEWGDAQAGWAVHHQALERLESEIKTLLEKFHRENPLRPGIPKEELRSRFPGLRAPGLIRRHNLRNPRTALDSLLYRR